MITEMVAAVGYVKVKAFVRADGDIVFRLYDTHEPNYKQPFAVMPGRTGARWEPGGPERQQAEHVVRELFKTLKPEVENAEFFQTMTVNVVRMLWVMRYVTGPELIADGNELTA